MTADKASSLGRLLEVTASALRPSVHAVLEALTSGGCVHDVKTIYISSTLHGDMVAAIYPHRECCEIALALPEDHPASLLEDATHLTWKTLPVMVTLDNETVKAELLDLVQEALRRVQAGQHDVNRPNEFFSRRARRTTWSK